MIQTTFVSRFGPLHLGHEYDVNHERRGNFTIRLTDTDTDDVDDETIIYGEITRGVSDLGDRGRPGHRIRGIGSHVALLLGRCVSVRPADPDFHPTAGARAGTAPAIPAGPAGGQSFDQPAGVPSDGGAGPLAPSV